MTTAIWIVIFVVLFFLHVAAEEKQKLRKEQEQREEAAKKTRHNLISYATPQIIAFGVPDSQKAPPPDEDQPTAKRGPDDELIDLEKGKWALVNAGRLLAGLMLTPGFVNVGFQPAGAISLEVKKTSWESPIGFSGQPEPFTLKDFHVVRPGPETAIVSYTAVSGYQSLNATTVWTRRGNRWVTSSYQMVKG